MIVNLVKSILLFLSISLICLCAAWMVSDCVLGWNAGNVYFSPLAIAWLWWMIWSLACGSVAYRLYEWLRETLSRKYLDRGPSAKAPVPFRYRSNPIYCLIIVAAGCGAIRYVYYLLNIGAPYEIITFPGTSHPTIEVRYSGFKNMTPYVFVAGPLYKMKVLQIPWERNEDKSGALPAKSGGRDGDGQVRTILDIWSPFRVRWSRRSAAFAVLHNGYYIAAYDLATGKSIQYDWWYEGQSFRQMRTVKPIDQIDKEIATFLKE